MTPEEIKTVFLEALKEHHTEFYVEAEKHWEHHKLMDTCQSARPEWLANHRFVSDVRANSKIVKKTSISLIVAAIVAWFIKTLFTGAA